MAQMVKSPPAMLETWLSSLGWEDPLEKGMATHSSIQQYMNLELPVFKLVLEKAEEPEIRLPTSAGS